MSDIDDFSYVYYPETEQLGVCIPRTNHTVIASGRLDGSVFHVRGNVFDACRDLRPFSDELKLRIAEDSINNRDVAIIFDTVL